MSQTIQAIAITEKSTKSLNAVVATLTKMLGEFPAAVEGHNDVVYNTEVAQNQLDLLIQKTADEERTAVAELKIRILENEDGVLADLLTKRGLAHVTKDDLAGLNSDYEAAQDSNESAISKAVAIAVAKEVAKSDLVLSEAKSAHAIAEAQNQADLKANAVQVQFLETQVVGLQEAAKLEREARVAMAGHASNASAVVVNTSGK
ncbi:MAG: hypothetical protein HRU18_03025 [Pseudoalteromonas sp.]|uniref:hypothetical protein n=1 Tax=Pseudoalteromonas sp. TaxID=53249 RepID=UPI001DFCE596|nr:hypothetical protein [Pseudoalteromonas sp.]NRA77157.1 hypothetical protein [Pseudoalteromonas sp.]